MNRIATLSDISRVRELMENTYHDPDTFTEYFFRFFGRPEDTFVYAENGRVLASMMQLPFRMRYNGEAYSAALGYGGAVDAEHRKRGLLKSAILYSWDIVRERGVVMTVANTNLSANRPWQSIGYTPAFPLHYRREERTESPELNARPAELRDVWTVKRLDELYERKFAAYAHPARGPEEWLHILCEYSLGEGGVMLLWERDALAGYLVFDVVDGEMWFKECACERDEMEFQLRQFTLRATGQLYAICQEPCTPENESLCVPSGIVKPLKEERMPSFPYEKGYLNLMHF